MLCLGRKPGERIVINGPAEVVVLSIMGSKCRLGIIADDSVNIVRGELLEAEPEPDEEVAA